MDKQPDVGVQPQPDSPPPSNIELFNQAQQMLRNQYFDDKKATGLDAFANKYSAGDLASDSARDKAIKDMADSLHDPWTEYVSPTAEQKKESLGGANVRDSGVWVYPNGKDYPVVQTVLPGFSAYDTPLRKGDIIEKINGQDTAGKSEEEVESMMQGKIGQEISVHYRQNDGPKGLDGQQNQSVERDTKFSIKEIEERESSAKVITDSHGKKILYASLPEFQMPAIEGFDNAMDKVLKENEHSKMPMILDLRGNSGGNMHSERYIDSEFIKDGVAYKQQERDGAGVKTTDVEVDKSLAQSAKPNDAERMKYLQEAPVVVMIDDASRSAAEAVTASLRAHGRTVAVVGTQSFGKGISYMDFDLGDGRLRISNGLVLSPKGENWHGKGLIPDVIVPRNRRPGHVDDQLAAAIKVLE